MTFKFQKNESGRTVPIDSIVFSDDASHELGFCKDADNYPRGMAENFEKLSEWWGSKDTSGFMSEAGKRLLFFTPRFRAMEIYSRELEQCHQLWV